MSYKVLQIDNSKDAAIQTGTWKNPGAKLYDDLMDAMYSKDGKVPSEIDDYNHKINSGEIAFHQKLLQEAYLVAPVSEIKNSPYGRTPFSQSGCKYPHHVIRDGKLVVSIPGVKAAYARAKQQGIFTGKVKEHLERHYKELGLYEDSTMKESVDPEDVMNQINEGFDQILSFLFEKSEALKKADEKEKAIAAKVDPDSYQNNNNDLVPIFGIAKSYSPATSHRDRSPKTKGERSSIKFSNQIRLLTRGDNYSHALVSFDSKLHQMYSFDDEGIVADGIDKLESWKGTNNIYICVMFIPRKDRDRMKKFVEHMVEHKEETRYALGNLIRMYIGKPIKSKKEFVCSTFTGYILSCSNPKNLHRDYSRLRPEDITILPRAFYVMNIKDFYDFQKKQPLIDKRVKEIFEENEEEIMEYNNELPKLMLKDTMTKLKTRDKIFNWIIRKIWG